MPYRFNNNANSNKKIKLRFVDGNNFILGLDAGDTVLQLKHYIWGNKLNGETAGFGRIQLFLFSGSGIPLDEGYNLYDMRKNSVIDVTIRPLIIGPHEDLRGERLQGVDLSGQVLAGVNLQSSDLTCANLTDTVLQNADLRGADLTNAFLIRADMRETKLQEANLFNANLQGADLERANLSRVDLKKANLSYAILAWSICARSDFTGANLFKANLTYAAFTYSILIGANLRETELNNANFDNVDHSGASFSGAKSIETANFANAINNPETAAAFWSNPVDQLFEAVKDGDYDTTVEILGKIPESVQKQKLKKNALIEALKHDRAGPIIDVLATNRQVIGDTLKHFDLGDPVHRNYNTKLRNDSFQYDKSRLRMTNERCQKANDIAELEDDVDIIEYLKADDVEDAEEKLKRAVFFAGEIPSELRPNVMSLNRLLYNFYSVVYTSDCIPSTDGTQYNPNKMKDGIFQFQFSSGPYNVYLKNLIDVILNSDKRVFYILPLMGVNDQGQPIQVSIERSASINNVMVDNPLGVEGNYIGGVHCQDGTDRKMYGIYACKGDGNNPLYPVCSQPLLHGKAVAKKLAQPPRGNPYNTRAAARAGYDRK